MYSPFDDSLPIAGRVRFHLVHEDGSEDWFEAENLVTTVGKGLIAGRMLNPVTAGHVSHIAIGTGATAPAVGDVALVTEVARAVLASATASLAIVTYIATFGPGVGTATITEAGTFTAAAGPSMQNRATFAGIVKAAGDTLNVTWTVTVG